MYFFIFFNHFSTTELLKKVILFEFVLSELRSFHARGENRALRLLLFLMMILPGNETLSILMLLFWFLLLAMLA